MSEEVLIPKMKRLESEDRELRIPWLNLALIVFCILLIVNAILLIFQSYTSKTIGREKCI